mmetsp:Transcript_18573/g.38853  ORF Transcript_18573/g.38853 Transcript_18573/m.38853 type:complete len:259 (+) Transcript_18573:13-789(+)
MPPIQTISHTTITFQSDIPSSDRSHHTSGILHIVKNFNHKLCYESVGERDKNNVHAVTAGSEYSVDDGDDGDDGDSDDNSGDDHGVDVTARDNDGRGGEEHMFIWLQDKSRVENANNDDDDDDDGAPDDATDAVDAEEVGACLAQGNGRNGVRFLDASHECNWFGLSCGDDPDDDAPAIDSDSSSPGTALSNDLDGYRPITKISLPRNNLRGTIPIEFYKVFGGLSTLNITDGNGVDGLMMTRGGDGMGAAEEAEIFA